MSFGCKVISKSTDYQLILKLEEVLNNSYLSGWDRSTEFAREIIDAEVYKRYNQAVEYVMPWVDRAAPLEESTVVEIGCGTGSSTVAFAHYAKHVYGYDINEMHVVGANARANAFGLNNVWCQAFPPEELLKQVAKKHQSGVDHVLLYAVLEHCTPSEVLKTLSTCWALLKPGGHMVVVETPNRLAYMDRHTAMMPFFHMLPTTTALEYSHRSHREDIKVAIAKARTVSEEDANMAIWRLGTGVSYHDFELAFEVQDLRPYLVCDGYEPEMLVWNPIVFDERLLQGFIVYHDLPVPLGFARPVLNLIFKKPKHVCDDDQLLPLINKTDRERFEPNLRSFLAMSDSDIFQKEFDGLYCSLWELTPDNIDCSLGLHQVELNVTDGSLIITSLGSDPYLLLPSLGSLMTASMMKIEVESSVSTVFEVFYLTEEALDYSQSRSLRFDIINGRNILFIRLPAGIVGQLRIDPGEKIGLYKILSAEIRQVMYA